MSPNPYKSSLIALIAATNRIIEGGGKKAEKEYEKAYLAACELLKEKDDD